MRNWVHFLGGEAEAGGFLCSSWDYFGSISSMVLWFWAFQILFSHNKIYQLLKIICLKYYFIVLASCNHLNPYFNHIILLF